MKTNIKSIIMVLLAGCMWGCMGLLVRPLNSYGLVSMDIVALRAFVTVSITLITFPLLCRIQKKKVKNEIRIKLNDIWIFIGTGVISIVFFNYCYFTTIVLTDLTVAAIMLYTAPVFVMVGSLIVFKNRLTVVKIISLVCACIGCVIVTGAFGGDMSVTAIGILYGIGSGVGYAMYSIFGKIATDRGYSSLTITVYTFLFASIGVLPFIKLQAIADVLVSNKATMLYSVLMIIFVTYLPYILYTAGLAGMEPGSAAIVACIEPVAATVVGIVFYNERPTLFTVAGVILVIGSIILVNAYDIKQTKEM